jgi:hypothetical protein
MEKAVNKIGVRDFFKQRLLFYYGYSGKGYSGSQ